MPVKRGLTLEEPILAKIEEEADKGMIERILAQREEGIDKGKSDEKLINAKIEEQADNDMIERILSLREERIDKGKKDIEPKLSPNLEDITERKCIYDNTTIMLQTITEPALTGTTRNLL